MDSVNAASGPFQKLDRNLIERISSSVVLLPLIALVVWWGEPFVSLVVIAVATLSLYELYSLFRAGGYAPQRSTGYLSVSLFIITAALRSRLVVLDWTGFALITAIVASLGGELLRRNRKQALLHWALTLAGATYIGWTLAHLVLLRNLNAVPLVAGAPLGILRLQPGAAWVVAVLAINFLSDTSAYAFGRAFGRHRLAPDISPKKSVEGAIGGVVTSTLAGVALVALLGLPISYLAGALLGAVGSVAAQAGDLAESLIKRQVNSKDSGHLIPGHGGMLDRIDSLLFTAPILYYMIVLFLSAF